MTSLVAKEKQSLDSLGYIPIVKEEVDRYTISNLAQYFSEPSTVKKKLSFQLATIKSDIPLKDKGIIPISLTDAEKIHSVMRVFTLFKYTTITLEETDYRNADVTVSLAEQLVNTDINGHKGILTLRRADNGSSLILLSWMTNSKLMKLSIAGQNVDERRMKLALQLARSIS